MLESSEKCRSRNDQASTQTSLTSETKKNKAETKRIKILKKKAADIAGPIAYISIHMVHQQAKFGKTLKIFIPMPMILMHYMMHLDSKSSNMSFVWPENNYK